jgi:hypothetical protein
LKLMATCLLDCYFTNSIGKTARPKAEFARCRSCPVVAGRESVRRALSL